MAKRLLSTSGITTAKAIELLRLYNTELVFQGFVDAGSATPATHTVNHAWIVIETGTVFGLAATKGQVIVDDGVAWNVYDMLPYFDFFPFKQPVNTSSNGNTLTVTQITAFVKEVYLEGIGTGSYFIDVIRRNSDGYWWIALKDGTGRVCEFPNTSTNPETNSGDHTLLPLKEINSSGISGFIKVDWSAVPDGSYAYGMSAELLNIGEKLNSPGITSNALSEIVYKNNNLADPFSISGSGNMPTKVQVINFLKGIYLEGYNEAETYYLELIRRNSGGGWAIRIADSLGVIAELPLTSVSPEPTKGGLSLHALSELNASGVSGYILVNWSAITSGSYAYGMSIELKGYNSLENNVVIYATKNKIDLTYVENRIVKRTKFIENVDLTSLGSGFNKYEIENFVREIYLKNTVGKHYLDAVRRNYSTGSWWIRVKNESGTVAEFPITTASPEPVNGGLSIHPLSELNGSGVTGYILVDWSAFPVGFYAFNMNAEFVGFDSFDNSPAIKTYLGSNDFKTSGPDIQYGACVNGLSGFFEKIRKGNANKQLQTKLVIWGNSIMGNNDRENAASREITVTPDETIEPPCFRIKYFPYRLWSQMCLNDIESNDSAITGVADDATAIRDYIFKTGINYKKAKYLRFDNPSWTHSAVVQLAMSNGDYTAFHAASAPVMDRTNRITAASATSACQVFGAKNLQVIYRSSDTSDQSVSWKIEELNGDGGTVVSTHSSGTFSARQENIDGGYSTDINGARRITIAQKREQISTTLDPTKFYKLTITKTNNTDEFCLWGVEYWGDYPILDVIVPARPGGNIEELKSNFAFDVIGHRPDGIIFEATRINDRGQLGGNPSITPGIEDTWPDKIGLINEHYREIFTELKQQGIPLLVLIVHDVSGWGFSLNDGWLKATRDLCNEMGIPYIDVNRWIKWYEFHNNVSSEDYLWDGVHLNDLGYSLYHQLFNNLLEYNDARNTPDSFKNSMKKSGTGTAGVRVNFNIPYKETPKVYISAKGSGQYISEIDNKGFLVAGTDGFDWESEPNSN